MPSAWHSLASWSAATVDRALAIRTDGVKRWHCHEYGCGKGGNLIGLCNYLREGVPDDGQPRGARFKQILLDLKAMAGGEILKTTNAATTEQITPPPPEEPVANLPLKDSENERARELVTLDERFRVVPDEAMSRYGAAYQRRRPFLTADVCREERCGYLPRPGRAPLIWLKRFWRRHLQQSSAKPRPYAATIKCLWH